MPDLEQDLTDLDVVLAGATAEGIDLTEPVCLIFAMILHFYPPEQAQSIVAGYVSRVPAGSTVVISTGRMDDPDSWHRMRDGYLASATYNHSRDEVAGAGTGSGSNWFSTLREALADDQLELYSGLIAVLKLSIEKGGSTDRNYVDAEGKKGSYLAFANVFHRQGQPCPRCGTTIEKIRVAGRGTHICPKEQRLPK